MTTPHHTDTAERASPAPDAPASPFAGLNSLKAKAPDALPVVTKEISRDIDKVAEDNKFHSRGARPATDKPAMKRRRFAAAEPKVQLNMKTSESERERFYRMAEELKLRNLGDLLTLALDALEAQEANGKRKR